MKLLSALVVALMVVGLFAGPALATEADAEAGASEGAQAESAPLTIDDVGQDNEVAQQFFPEDKEQATVFPPILYALLGAGLLITVVLFILYLSWLPRFNRERREKAR